MDPGTIIGIVIALVAILGSNVMEGGSPAALFMPAPLLLVFGGTVGVAMAGGMLKDSAGLVGAVKHAFTSKMAPADESVTVLIGLAEQARRNGLLALEESARTVEDPFLRQGVELLVDGTDPEELRDIFDAKVDAKRAVDKSRAKMFMDMGAYAPTIGIIGTVMGLVHVLEQLDEPEKLGHLIAGAFLATLWGVLSANVLFMPIGNKLKRVSELEVRQMNLLIEGLMAIQAGSNPRMLEQKLLAFLPAQKIPAADEKQAA